MGAGFLHGVTVLDLATVGPAARCSRILADYGAAVVKVGPPPAKQGVQIQPPFFTYSAGRGTRRVQIDLKQPRGTAAFLRLAAGAQVVIESFRPGVVARLGIGWEAVRAVNPALVYCSTSGYGQDGPQSAWAGHDLNYLADGGFLAMSGRRADGGPALPGATIADAAGGGMHAAIAVLAALVRARQSGVGAYLDVSVAEGVLSLMGLTIDEHLATGCAPAPGGDLLTGRYACYDVYRARDARWLSVAAIEPQFWANLCRLLELPEWTQHQRDDERQDAIRADLRRVFATRDRDDWVARLAGNDTCVAPVREIAELPGMAQHGARRAFADAEHPTRGRFRQLAPVLAGCERGAAAYRVPDATVTDTDAVLAAAGLGSAEIAELRAAGVVA
ncbi:MAG: CoA transferase [Deltaproteobacteria bacterium]|nr:CoA transferase [Deltaproteobacteria bacterium]